jgi:6-phosphofructo-2-kinase
MPAGWYDPVNAEGFAARGMACDAALADLLEYMNRDGVRVAAFDATNSTKARRKHILEVLKKSGLGAKRMFVESICDEEEVRITCSLLLWAVCVRLLSSNQVLVAHIFHCFSNNTRSY